MSEILKRNQIHFANWSRPAALKAIITGAGVLLGLLMPLVF